MWRIIPVILAPALTASAGDVASFLFLGFSPDGAYLAWIEHGTQDGSGFDYCSARIQETGSGTVIAGTDVVIDPFESAALDRGVAGPALPSAVDSVMHIMGPSMAAAGIDGSCPGTLCVSHPLTDLGVPWDIVAFDIVERADPARQDCGAIVALEQEEIPVDSIREMWGFDPVVIEVSLFDRLSGTSSILYTQRGLGPGQEYRQGCRIGEVYVLGDSVVAVVLDVFRLGFEGSDVRHMVISGDMSFVDAGW